MSPLIVTAALSILAAAAAARAPPDGLTPADAAYLSALYAADSQEKKAGYDVASRMAKIIVNANPQQDSKS